MTTTTTASTTTTNTNITTTLMIILIEGLNGLWIIAYGTTTAATADSKLAFAKPQLLVPVKLVDYNIIQHAA